MRKRLSEGPLEEEVSEQRPIGTEYLERVFGKGVLAGGNSKAKGCEVRQCLGDRLERQGVQHGWGEGGE